MSRSNVLQVTLGPVELERLQSLATKLGIKPATYARSLLKVELDRLSEKGGAKLSSAVRAKAAPKRAARKG
jgi:hypothetical protein